MTYFRQPSLCLSTALAAVVCASNVSADVTAQQVWDSWSTQMEQLDQGFTTTGETMEGDTLTISGARIETTEDDTAIVAELGDIRLVENGDGTVSITMAQSYPIEISGESDFGDDMTANLMVDQTGLAILVSGDPDAMDYDLSAERMAITILSVDSSGGDDVTIEDAVMSLLGVTGQYSVDTDEVTGIAYDMEIGAIDLDLSIINETQDATIQMNGDVTDMTLTAEMALPSQMDTDADMPPFADGFAFDGGYSFGATEYTFNLVDAQQAVSGAVSIGQGALDVAMDIDGASYRGETNEIAVAMSIPQQFPFPIEVSLAKYGIEFLAPLSESDGAPQDARIAFNLTDLVLSDAIWSLFDPQEVLPRDPFTISVGLDALLTPYFDVLDPAQQQAAMAADLPGEINSARISELRIQGAGAEITGEGAFTFDNTDLSTFDGFPRPEGQASFAINGVNALIDNLVQLGLIPQEDAMMPRMMMGMFSTPVGDDMLTSTIEVNGEGHVLANGQRLR